MALSRPLRTRRPQAHQHGASSSTPTAHELPYPLASQAQMPPLAQVGKLLLASVANQAPRNLVTEHVVARTGAGRHWPFLRPAVAAIPTRHSSPSRGKDVNRTRRESNGKYTRVTRGNWEFLLRGKRVVRAEECQCRTRK